MGVIKAAWRRARADWHGERDTQGQCGCFARCFKAAGKEQATSRPPSPTFEVDASVVGLQEFRLNMFEVEDQNALELPWFSSFPLFLLAC